MSFPSNPPTSQLPSSSLCKLGGLYLNLYQNKPLPNSLSLQLLFLSVPWGLTFSKRAKEVSCFERTLVAIPLGRMSEPCLWIWAWRRWQAASCFRSPALDECGTAAQDPLSLSVLAQTHHLGGWGKDGQHPNILSVRNPQQSLHCVRGHWEKKESYLSPSLSQEMGVGCEMLIFCSCREESPATVIWGER